MKLSNILAAFFFFLSGSSSSVWAREEHSVAEVRRLRGLGYGGQNHHRGGDNGRDHPGCCGANNGDTDSNENTGDNNADADTQVGENTSTTKDQAPISASAQMSQEDDDDGLSTGIILGIALGSAALLAASLAALLTCLANKKAAAAAVVASSDTASVKTTAEEDEENETTASDSSPSQEFEKAQKPSSEGTEKTMAPATNAGETISTLREASSNMEKREEHLQRKIKLLIQEARQKYAKGDKKGAVHCMKRKTLYEKEVEKMENVKMTLETQVIHLESAAQNAATLQAIQTGSQAMRRVQTEMGGLDKVDNLMDDIREGMETAREIEDALSQPLDPLFIDNDDLLEELAELENQDVADALLDACALVSTTVVSVPTMDDLTLPTVPNTSVLPTVLSRQEEEDLEQLEAEIEGLAA